eukprot:c23147_g1_i2 orf=526-1464(+)
MAGSFWLLAVQLIGFVNYPLSAVRFTWGTLANVIAYVMHPWRRVFFFFFYTYLGLSGHVCLLLLKFISALLHLLTALQRQKLLEAQIHDIQIQLEESMQNNREMKRKLDLTLKDHTHIEELLSQADDKNIESNVKIQVLEIQVQELEAQRLALQLQQNRLSKAIHEMGVGEKNINCKVGRQDSHSRFKNPSGKVVRMDQPAPMNEEALLHWRGVALASSIFSASLALLVAMVAWEAEDPCMPLVVALFIVVCVSLKSVMHLFLGVDKRPGFDAVALLSFNSFIMGTLAFPALPIVAKSITPALTRFGSWIIK